jgi:NTP pyrophosphatase (non-canonical NTP hydrolase)
MFVEQLVIEGEITPRFVLVSEGISVDWEGYQRESRKTAIYPNCGSNPIYPTLGLAGEAGEVANVVKKMWREHEGEIDSEHRKHIAEELGDVLWYLTQLATELHVSLADIVRVNLAKIKGRYLNDEDVVKVESEK